MDNFTATEQAYKNGYEQGVKDATDTNVGNKWVSVEERLPSKEESERCIVGIVKGNNGKICFYDASIFVLYDQEENVWFSWDYDIEGCEVKFWMALPEPPEEE